MSGHVFAETAEGLRFVGDFEALYSEEADPWRQSATEGELADYYATSRRTLAEILSRYGVHRGLEIGCGYGNLTAYLQGRLDCRMTGMDISRAAVAKARETQFGPRFMVGDILAPDFKPPARFDCVIWGQILWYVLHDIERAVENSIRCAVSGGILAVSQAFLSGGQRYGRDVADGFHGAVRLFSERFADRLTLIEARYDDRERFVHRDGVLIFRVR